MAKDKRVYKKKANGKINVGVKEKYTAAFMLNEIKEINAFLDSDEGNDIVFIGEMCIIRGYSPQRWSEIKDRHIDNKIITESIKIIEAKLEYRLYKAGLTNAVNATMCLAGLNNKYRWENAKQKLDHSSEDGTMSPKALPDIVIKVRNYDKA
jgi:hypothetical protein